MSSLDADLATLRYAIASQAEEIARALLVEDTPGKDGAA